MKYNLIIILLGLTFSIRSYSITKVFPDFIKNNCQSNKQVKNDYYNLILSSGTLNLKSLGQSLLKSMKMSCTHDSKLKAYITKVNDYIETKRKKNYQEMIKFDYNKRPKCDMNFLAVTDAIRYAKEQFIQTPKLVSSIKKLKKNYLKEIKIMNDEGVACPYSFNDQLTCSPDSGIKLAKIVLKSKTRSVQEDVIQIARKINNDCTARDLLPLHKSFAKVYRKIVVKSKAKEFDYQVYRYNYSYGLENSRGIYENLERLARELNDPVKIDAVYQLRRPPTLEEFKEFAQNRKASCFDIDLTNYHNQPEGDQGMSGTCYAFGGVGILNNALGVDNINPLYLYLLSISEKVFPNHYPIYDDIMDTWSESNFSDRGGFARSVAKAALKFKNYCTVDDLYNPWNSKEDLGIILAESDTIFNDFVKGPKTEKFRKEFFKKNKSFFKEMFPKMTYKEFKSIVEKYHGTSAGLFRKLVFSQCKTPLPKVKDDVKVHHSFNFDPEKIDALLNDGRVITFNHNMQRLFKDNRLTFWPNHVALMTGRRWNPIKSRCEYRIVNSHGEQCSGLEQTDDAVCNEQGMWISEGLAQWTHFNHEYTTGPRPSDKPYHPAMDPDAIE